ncbi:MAG: DsbA family protein [Candidatus Diapherotrites archaeon]|nr:DsbA family protein [Candidatus Diapherotrites archaeon]
MQAKIKFLTLLFFTFFLTQVYAGAGTQSVTNWLGVDLGISNLNENQTITLEAVRVSDRQAYLVETIEVNNGKSNPNVNCGYVGNEPPKCTYGWSTNVPNEDYTIRVTRTNTNGEITIFETTAAYSIQDVYTANQRIQGIFEIKVGGSLNPPAQSMTYILKAHHVNNFQTYTIAEFDLSQWNTITQLTCSQPPVEPPFSAWQCVYAWDSTQVPDGDYVIKVATTYVQNLENGPQPGSGYVSGRHVINNTTTEQGTATPAPTQETTTTQPVPQTEPTPIVQPPESGTENTQTLGPVPKNLGEIEFIEYSDFQCPFCKIFFDQTLPQLKARYGEKFKYEFKHFPLQFHSNAEIAAEASECARDQEKFSEFHDLLFQNQNDWANLSNPIEKFKEYADSTGIITYTFQECIQNGNKKSLVQADYQEGMQAGIDGTPGFIINGKKIVGAQPFASFVDFIEGKTTPTQGYPKEPSNEPTPYKGDPQENSSEDTSEKMIALLFKLENLSIRFEKLEAQAEKIMNYYQSVNSPKYEAWKTVQEQFQELINVMVENKNKIKETAQANGNQFTNETVELVNQTIQAIKQGLTQIAFSILG